MAKKRAESRTRYFIRTQSSKRGWQVKHLSKGGDFLEEQEISNHFPDIGLGLTKPDFMICLSGEPCAIIEAKNDIKKIDSATAQAIGYANEINKTKKYSIKMVVGVAGEEDNGYLVEVKYLKKNSWIALKSQGYQLTSIPSKREIELALEADDATTSVSVPSSSEFIDAALEVSNILRLAKIEAPLRPKVIGAIVLAMYQGKINTTEKNELSSINELIEAAISESVDISESKKEKLKAALSLTGNDYSRLNSKIRRIIAILRRLNIRSVLHTDTDFLGMFYEAFLRYGNDNNALGIVFTPRHITRFCVDLIGVNMSDRVIDIASGTGGFLVAAFDRMMSTAKGLKAIEKVKESLYGFDTNPTVWALATLNMFFRGDGKSHIENGNCLDEENKKSVRAKFTRAFLNPPFSQEEEPERDFIDAALEALEPNGLLMVVVKAGIFADGENKIWRKKMVRKHSILGLISLPEDLFYPTAAPTSILITKAHIPQDLDDKVYMARIWNDGYEKLKGRRIECEGSQLDTIKATFHQFLKEETFTSDIATIIAGKQIFDGAELSPQQWLPQPILSYSIYQQQEQKLILSIFQAISAIPELADEVLPNFIESWKNLPPLPLNKKEPVNYFFKVLNGKSSGEKNYNEGNCPYISSGDLRNSIIRLVAQDTTQTFEEGGITVTAFGQAYLQPWGFMARGNGGSAVRVLMPKYRMSLNELIWFCIQINIQRWRFFYGRMAIKSRLERLIIQSPEKNILDTNQSIKERIEQFKESLFQLSKFRAD